MAGIRIIIAGAAGGIVAAIVSFAVVLSTVTAFKESPGAGFAILITSPLYFFLYIVVFFKTLLLAGLITGTAAGLIKTIVHRPWNIIPCSLTGLVSGAFFGIRFIDIALENRDTTMDLVAGGIAGGLFFALSGYLICAMIYRSQK